MTSLFSKIIAREIPADIVFENEKIIAIKDIYPIAPIHILIIPKKEIPNLQSLEPSDFGLLGDVVAVAQKLAEEFEIEVGYRLLTNNGGGAGQTIFHLHFHLIGGRNLGELG